MPSESMLTDGVALVMILITRHRLSLTREVRTETDNQCSAEILSNQP